MLKLVLTILSIYRLLKRNSRRELPSPVIRENSNIVQLEAINISNWAPVTLQHGVVAHAQPGDSIGGIHIIDPFIGTIMVSGARRFSCLPPSGRYLTIENNEFVWRDKVTLGQPIFASIVMNYILITETIMSYATGKSDFADHKTYPGQGLTNWPYQPVTGQPVCFTNGELAPAFSDTEIIYAIVLDSQQVLDQAGALSGYDVKVLIAEAGIDGFTNNQADIGQVLYVQDYAANANPTFADMYSTTAPASGFTHPLYKITGTSTLHFNGTVRPDAI
jgi:hypothetical protein